MDPLKIVKFLKERIYLIDIKKPKKYELVFTIEEKFKNYLVSITDNLISCSCERQLICKHSIFILEKMAQIKRKNKRSKSYNSITDCQRLFYIDLKRDYEPHVFISDRNPRYLEYRLEYEPTERNENCHICLSKLSGKTRRCKTCNNHYHEDCIYAWLRCSPGCNCPICRSAWM
jgi:hypothetical protein